MALSDEPRRAGPYTGDGSVVEFPFGFRILTNDDLAVYTREPDGDSVLREAGTDYTVVRNSVGGTVVFGTAPGVGTTVTVLGAQAYEQPLTLVNQGPYFAEDVMRALDRNTILTQQLREENERALKSEPDGGFPPEVQIWLDDAAASADDASGFADAAAGSADDAAFEASKAEFWAEGTGSYTVIGSKSAKEWAGEAESAKDGAEGAKDGAETAAIAAASAKDDAEIAAVATAADRDQTGLDRVATGEDATATAADRDQTGLDRVATGEDATATAADRVQTGQDAAAAAGSATTAGNAAATAETARDKSQEWAESEGQEPGGPGTKSAKEWAGEAEEFAADVMPFLGRSIASSASVASDVEYIEVIHNGRKLGYMPDAMGTALTTNAGARSWSPAGIITPDHWGASGVFNEDCRAEFQAMFDWIIAKFDSSPNSHKRKWAVTLLAGRTYLVEGEIDLTGFTRRITGVIQGETSGSWNISRIRVSPFGGAKKLFKFGDVTCRVLWANFQITGSVRHKDNPTLFWIPRLSTGGKFINVTVVGGAGSVLVANNVFNPDISLCDWYSCGWQPLAKEVSPSARLACTAGSVTVTATESVFAASDVGRTLFIENASSGARNGHASAIAAYVSPTQVTLERAPSSSRTSAHFSFETIRGSISSGANSLEFNAPHGLESSDVGRLVYIDNADVESAALCAEITAITNSTTVTISKSAGKNASNVVVFFTPQISVGRALDGAVSATGGFLNDLGVSQLLIENYQGPAVFLSGGTHFYADQLKMHGVPRSTNNFATSICWVFNSGTTRVSIAGLQGEHGNPPLDFGYIVSRGEANTVVSGNYNAVRSNGPLLENIFTDRGFIQIGPGQVNMELTDLGPPVVSRGDGISDAVAGSRASFYGALYGLTATGDTGLLGGQVGGSFRSSPTPVVLQDDTAWSMPAPSPHGFFFVSTVQGFASQGLIYYRQNGNTLLISVNGGDLAAPGGILSGASGPDGSLNFSIDSGRIYMENRTGSTRSVAFTFLN